MPILSIVIPTRDRPEFVELALYSLISQPASDFEVIVCDNFQHSSCRSVVESFNDKRIHYIRPSSSLGMCENWDYAINAASGDYVTVLIDKYMFYSFAIERIIKAIDYYNHPDIVSWICDGIFPENSSNTTDLLNQQVTYYPQYKSSTPCLFDPKEELARRRRNSSYHRGDHGPLYFRGKLCSGAYKRSLLDSIRNKHGRICPPFAPDFTSCTLGLVHAKSGLDLNQVLAQYGVYDGNGAETAHRKGALRKFLEQNDSMKFKDLLPIAGLYSSSDNWVAWDLYADTPRDKHVDFKGLGFCNLVNYCSESLKNFPWENEEQRVEQLNLLNNCEKEGGDSFVNNFEKTTKTTIRSLLSTLGLLGIARKIRFGPRSNLIGKRKDLFHIISNYHNGKISWSKFIKNNKSANLDATLATTNTSIPHIS